MIGSKKPLTPMGKFLARMAIDRDWSRTELAAQIGVSDNLLHKLMHGGGYKLVSVQRVITAFKEQITDEMAEQFCAGSKEKTNRYVFELIPGTAVDFFMKSVQETMQKLSQEEIERVFTTQDGEVWLLDYRPGDERLTPLNPPAPSSPGADLGPPEITDKDLKGDEVGEPPAATVPVDYTYSEEEIEELRRRAEAGESLTAHEVVVLSNVEAITDDKMAPGSVIPDNQVEPGGFPPGITDL